MTYLTPNGKVFVQQMAVAGSHNPREGRPKTTTIQGIVEKVHDIVLDDWRVKVSEIARTWGYQKKVWETSCIEN
jgi:hypothetical protein